MRLYNVKAIARRGWLTVIIALLAVGIASADISRHGGVITSYQADGASGTITYTITNTSGTATTGGTLDITTNTGSSYTVPVDALQPGQSISGGVTFGPPGGPVDTFSSSSASAVLDTADGGGLIGLASSEPDDCNDCKDTY
jgi:hypothetical protein